jgi:hypothetical protein
MKRRDFLKAAIGMGIGVAGLESQAEEEDFFSAYYNRRKMPVVKALETVEKGKYDLSKLYEEDSEEDRLQSELRIGTRTLNGIIEQDILYNSFIHPSRNEAEVKDYLVILSNVRDIFCGHPFCHVLNGRLKEVVQMASKAKIPIPQEFQEYVGATIFPWECPHLNYRTLDDIRNSDQKTIIFIEGDGTEVEIDKLESIPPEYR